MPNAAVRANARTLPNAIQYPEPAEIEAVQPSRRGLLGGISALFAGAAAASVGAEPAGSAPLPASATPTAPTLSPAAADAELIALGRKADGLWDERLWAVDDRWEAQRRFSALLGEPPPELLCLDDAHPGAPLYRSMRLITSEALRRDLPDYNARSRIGRWMRRALKVAVEYEERKCRALRDSELDEVDLRIMRLDGDIRKLVPEAFAYAPTTLAGCVALARCLLAAWEWAPDQKEVNTMHARRLVEALGSIGEAA